MTKKSSQKPKKAKSNVSKTPQKQSKASNQPPSNLTGSKGFINSIKTNYITILIGIFLLASSAFVSAYFTAQKYKNNNANSATGSTEVAQNTNNTKDSQASPDSNKNNSKQGDDNKNNKGSGSFFRPPSDITGKITIPTKTPTPTPTPTKSSSSISGINMDYVHNMNFNSTTISTGAADAILNQEVTAYAWYLGLGKDVDKVFPENAHVFIGIHLDGKNTLITHYYVASPSAIKGTSSLTYQQLYEFSYKLSDDVDPIKDKDFVFHRILKLDIKDKLPYKYIATGIYKGKASDTLGDKYIGYADLQATWQGKTVHMLISLAKTSNIEYEKGKAYTFVTEDADIVSGDPDIYLTTGGIIYLEDY